MLMIHCTVYDQEKLKLSTSNKGDFLRNFPTLFLYPCHYLTFLGRKMSRICTACTKTMRNYYSLILFSGEAFRIRDITPS